MIPFSLTVPVVEFVDELELEEEAPSLLPPPHPARIVPNRLSANTGFITFDKYPLIQRTSLFGLTRTFKLCGEQLEYNLLLLAARALHDGHIATLTRG
jgi:hypothetical protein